MCTAWTLVGDPRASEALAREQKCSKIAIKVNTCRRPEGKPENRIVNL
jgi:hypothetical protein